MHPVLKDFPSGRFYDGRLEDGVSAIERPAPAGVIWPDWDAPVAFIPIEGVEQLDSEGTSKSNLDEAGRVATLVQELLAPGDLICRDIGIITPYNGQVRVLSDIFENMGGRSVGEPYEGLEIKSVDGYQGREKEVIIFSAVRANEKGEIGFLSDRRRLNVAITRAKRGLIVLGNMKTLRHDHTWAAWLDWVQEKGLVAWHAVNG
jgi:regulator of nonsense transcripts 1